jgi:hypothetical protein
MTNSSDAGQRERRMTVARVRENGDGAEVMFVESARIYRLARANPAYDDTLAALRASAATGKSLRVHFDKPNGELIEHAVAPPR